MKPRFTLYKRRGVFYAQDTVTGRQKSLGTRDAGEAKTLLNAENEAHRQPILNLQIARTYLTAADPEIGKRTWQHVMDEMAKTKRGPSLHRHQTGVKDQAFDLIRHLPILETQTVQFMRVLKAGTVSTNIFLRRIHNFAMGVNWLPWPILAKRGWPKIVFKEKRAVTLKEHEAIVTNEHNPERRAYYELAGTWVEPKPMSPT